MKIKFWFKVIATLCLVAVTLFVAGSCNKLETQPKHYILNFSGEGVDIEPQLIASGDHAIAPENPQRESYDFDGWFTDTDTFANPWDFETDVVTQDTTLYAKWELIKICNVDNPLTDLPWLKEIIDEFEKNAATLGYNPHARIYQCTYKDGIGFLLEMCVGCPDTGYSFRNCEGEILCEGGGLSGEDSCPELNIDYENKKLIWEKEVSVTLNIDFSNIEDLYAQPLPIIQECIKGEWKVYDVSRWGISGYFRPANTFVTIDTQNNIVEITVTDYSGGFTIMNGEMIGTFPYNWEKEEVHPFSVATPRYSTYVMQFYEYEPSDDVHLTWGIEKIGWYFENIKKDTLTVVTFFTPDISNFAYYEKYKFSKWND